MSYRKYRNVKMQLDGYTFDSKAEARRYGELKLLQEAGEITDLVVHPVFVLQPAFRDFRDEEFGDFRGGRGKYYRAITYAADFQYLECGQTIVEDVKGKRTAVFNIKLKMFLYRYPPDVVFRLIPA